MGRKPDLLRQQLGFTRQEKQDCIELASVSEERFQAALTQAKAEAVAAGRPLTEARVKRILNIGRERRRQNVGSADDIPSEDWLTWAADLTPEERCEAEMTLQTILKALQLTKK